MKLSRKELIKYFFIAFLWMWIINALRILNSAALISLPINISNMLGYMAVFGPAISAFYLTRQKYGNDGVKRLWKNGWIINFNKKWLIIAVGLMPVMGLFTVLIMNGFNIKIQWEYGLSPAMIVPVWLLLLLLGHLPLHFIPGTTQYNIPFWQFIIQTVGINFLYTWLFLETKGSVLIASLFHTSANITGAIIPYWTTDTGRWVSIILLLIPIIYTVKHITGRKLDKEVN